MSDSAIVDSRVLDALIKGPKIGVIAVEKMRILSSGNYSTVYLSSSADGNNRIFKVLSKKSTQLHALHRIRTEIVVHRLVNEHPNVIRLLDVEESEDKVILEVEYAPKGDLFDLVVRSGGLPWFKASRIFADIVHGVHFIHSKGLCHRDIKPENILIRSNMSAAITDFGFATWSSKGLTEPCGSLPFAAPELLVGKNIIYDGQASDMWSLGVVLFMMITGNHPWTFAAPKCPSYSRYLAGERDNIWGCLTPEVSSLLHRMLNPIPHKRITIEELRNSINSSWYKSLAIAVDTSRLLSPNRVESDLTFDRRNRFASSEDDIL